MGRLFSISRIAAAYAGTVVGAGFASGQELLQFFVSYGTVGIVSMVLAGILFAFLGSRILELGYRFQAESYHEILYAVCGRRLGRVLDGLTALFLFGGLCIMLSSTRSVCRDYGGVDGNLGALFMALAVAITVRFGVNAVSAVNLLVIPLLVGASAIVSVDSMLYHHNELFDLMATLPPQPQLSPIFHWLPACFLYVSYNLILGATLLAPLGRRTPDKVVRVWGAIIGGALLAALGLMIMTVIMLHYPEILGYEVPMLYVSQAQHGLNHLGYAAMLLKAMFSTALASLYGCTVKMQSATGLSFTLCLIIISTAGWGGSQFGFATLVSLLYPLFGYLSLGLTVGLLWQFYRDRK